MNAVVEIAGQQFEVKENDVLTVPLLEGEPGSGVEFNKILLTQNNGDINVGTPTIEGSVKAEILEHGRGDKIIIFHKKRRKGYRKLKGHKQNYTQIKITDINA